jgi:D-alanyl-D-alanine carboxypeptidase
VISPRRFAALGVLCGTAVLAAAVGLAGLGSQVVERLAASMKTSPPTSVRVDAKTVDAAQATTRGEDGVDAAIGDIASRDTHPTPRGETATEQVAVQGTPASLENDVKQPASSSETLDECSASESCVDQYLWSVYQRAPKVDTIRVPEQIEVKVKKKGKTRVITKTVTKLVDEDFTWKDPKAAQKAGMSLVDYVIGGMDRSFKLRLYRALLALDDAGLSPGITSGFRDDYRQSLASGNKAAIDSSYHGGSRRGGHGHGLAVDLVSVKGETRAERFSSSEKLWKWIDAHGKEFGIGRPYLDKDPPHVAPIDGKEYADHRGGPNAQPSALEANRSHRSTTQDDHKTKKRAGAAKSSRVKSI